MLLEQCCNSQDLYSDVGCAYIHWVPISYIGAHAWEATFSSDPYYLGLGDIPVLRYYHDKYIHDNIIASILMMTMQTITPLLPSIPLLAEKCSRCKFETSCLHNVVHSYYRQYHKY